LKESKDDKNKSASKSKVVKSFIKIAKPEMDIHGFHHTKETFDKQKKLNDPRIQAEIMERAINQSRRSRRSRVTQEQDSDEESDETIPENHDMASLEMLSTEEEPEPEEVPAWKTPLPENAPAEAKDPRFYGNVPAVWTQRIQSAGRAVERSENAGLVLFGYD
jgi:hypothetical protein